jgi:hypothetical protein
MVAMKRKRKIVVYDRVVICEAKRQVRLWVKDMLKRRGVKVSHVSASSITEAVNKIMAEHGMHWLILAKREIKRLERQEAKIARQIKWS